MWLEDSAGGQHGGRGVQGGGPPRSEGALEARASYLDFLEGGRTKHRGLKTSRRF